MAQQTAVQWLWEKLQKGEFINNPDELLEQANTMFEEQIKKTYNDAINNMDYFTSPPSAEQYYNQTFKTE